MKKLLTTIPFCGFYNSVYSEEIDYCMEREAENLAESHDITIGQASEMLYKYSDFTVTYEKISKAYVKKFNSVIAENFGFDLHLEFESMKSPKEYNFTTDIIFAYLPDAGLKTLLEAIDQTVLAKLIIEKFTSRSGFISFYSNSLAEWLKQPFSDWDHNQLGTLFECRANRVEDWENDVYEDMQESIYIAFSDCVKWAEIEAEIEELKMRAETVKIYKFEELPTEQAKEKAREWYRTMSQGDPFYAECVIDDTKEIAALMGIEIDKIYYSGFSSQGDGASYIGHYRYKKGALRAVKRYAPKDTELHKIAKELQDIQRKWFYRISAYIIQSGHYQHEMTMEFAFMLDGEYLYDDKGFEEELKEALRDYAVWVYKLLETSYDWENSDSVIEENIIMNEYEFIEDGSIY